MAARFAGLLTAAALFCGLPNLGGAAQHDANEAICRDADAPAADRIAACTVLLDDYAYTDLSDYALTHLSRAVAYRDTRNHTEALSDLDVVLDYDPFAFDAYMTRGEVLLTTGEIFRAIADFTVAIGLDPLNSAPYAWRGTALYAHREYPEAQRDLESALGFDAENARAITTLAWILAAAPDPTQRDGARALSLTDSLNADAADAAAPVKLVRAAALAESGDIDAALAVYAGLLNASPGVAKRFGGYLAATGHLENAAVAEDLAQLNAGLRACLESGCRIGAPLARP